MKAPAERVVKDIRRQTRRHFSAEDKIRIVLDGLRGDDSIAERFFSSLKRIRRRTYKTREEARQDVSDYVEMFYNPVRKQVINGMLSPVEFERQQILKAEGV